MSDIVDRLRRWTHAVDAAPASDLMDEAADEIKRLRSALAAYTGGIFSEAESKPTVRIDGIEYPYSYQKNTEMRVFYDTSVVENESCPYVTGNVTRYCTLTPLALTTAERCAIEEAAADLDDRSSLICRQMAKNLRGLLERTK